MEDEPPAFAQLEVPPRWVPHRPGDLDERGRRVETPAGPDQGYAALLAERFSDRVVLGKGEHLDDVLAAATEIALARARRFGRAPVGKDLEYALSVFGFLSQPAEELLNYRRALIGGVAHDGWLRRTLVAAFSDDLLSMTPAQAGAAELWRKLAVARS